MTKKQKNRFEGGESRCNPVREEEMERSCQGCYNTKKRESSGKKIYGGEKVQTGPRQPTRTEAKQTTSVRWKTATEKTEKKHLSIRIGPRAKILLHRRINRANSLAR